MIPLHLWLPEVHVEAPTGGSVMLASLLLKLGGYGFIRIILPNFSVATFFFTPFVDTLALISMIYASITAVRQLDLKRIVAYSSIAHMNLGVLGIFSGNIQGLSGSVLLMLAHGLTSASLFFLVGMLYQRHGSRNIFDYGGLSKTMPIFSNILLYNTLANIGFPGTSNFIGELLIFAGLVDKNILLLVLATPTVVLSTLYSIFLYSKLVYGNLNKKSSLSYKDLDNRETFLLTYLMITNIFFGI
jgi:proton-translocating NADH-quinone oxidoreductase chain M